MGMAGDGLVAVAVGEDVVRSVVVHAGPRVENGRGRKREAVTDGDGAERNSARDTLELDMAGERGCLVRRIQLGVEWYILLFFDAPATPN
jgi:hypothetical protein